MAKTNEGLRAIIRANPNKSNKELVDIVYKELGRTYTESGIKSQKKRMQQTNTFGEHLESNGFQENNWKHGWLKVDGASIFIHNDEDVKRIQNMLDEHIERIKKHAPKYTQIKRGKDKDLLLVLDPADIHIGKLCVVEETGHNYNINEAVRRTKLGVSQLLERANKHAIGRIVFVIGNDVVHIDNAKRMTTAGTSQDTDGQWFQMFEAAHSVYVAIIEELMQIADVHVVHCMSNHDFTTGFDLAHSLKSWFRHSKNVTFDVLPQHNKYIVYGWNLIGLAHGDGAKHTDMQHIMAKEARNAWSSTRYRYWYLHHIHHKDRKSYAGKATVKEKDETAVSFIHSVPTLPQDTVHVEFLRSPSPPDGWHQRNGYINDQAVECFLHHPYGGQIARFTIHF